MIIKEFSKDSLNFITVKNAESFEITLCDLGASIFSIIYDNKLMTMTPSDVSFFKYSDLYNGKTIGRTSNRIKGNVISIDGTNFKLKNNDGPNTLHGGIDGISNKIFTYKIEQEKTQTKVIFRYTSKNKEGGFPGTLKIKVTYIISEISSKFKIKFDAKTTKPTLCNLTNHTFFTLDKKSLDFTSLKINASNYLECSEKDLLPIRKSHVTKALDFNKTKPILKDISSLRVGQINGYDHNFYFDYLDNLKTKVVLKTEKYCLKIKTDFACCQIYTDNWPNNSISWINLGKGSNRSVAIEPQDDFLIRKVLRPSEKYNRFISYEFAKNKY